MEVAVIILSLIVILLAADNVRLRQMPSDKDDNNQSNNDLRRLIRKNADSDAYYPDPLPPSLQETGEGQQSTSNNDNQNQTSGDGGNDSGKTKK